MYSSQYSVPAQPEAIKTKRQRLRRVPNAFVSYTMSVNFDIFPGLLFTPG